jgi:hypothetical protein
MLNLKTENAAIVALPTSKGLTLKICAWHQLVMPTFNFKQLCLMPTFNDPNDQVRHLNILAE